MSWNSTVGFVLFVFAIRLFGEYFREYITEGSVLRIFVVMLSRFSWTSHSSALAALTDTLVADVIILFTSSRASMSAFGSTQLMITFEYAL